MKKTIGLLSLSLAVIMSGTSLATEFRVPVKLMKAYEESESMGAKAIIPTAKVVEEDGKATVYLSAKGLEFMQMFGHIMEIRVYKDGIVSDKAHLDSAGVVEEEMSKGLDGNERMYPSVFKIVRDKTREETVGVRVMVDAMASIAADKRGEQDARLILDYKNAIEVKKEEPESKYISGYEDGSFKPDKDMSRAEASKVLAVALGTDFNENGDYESDFSDVSSDAWYYRFVSYMKTKDHIKGKGDNKFAPESSITRAEFVTMATNIMGAKEDNASSNFLDVEGHWAEKNIKAAVLKGWIKGYSDNTFRPDANITRAEVVTIINNIKNARVDKENIENNISKYKQFNDINNKHWAYYQVLIAANGNI